MKNPRLSARQSGELIQSAHFAIPLAITLALLAQLSLVETCLPHFRAILPSDGPTLMEALHFDASRSHVNTL
jgi:hypothetical protein